MERSRPQPRGCLSPQTLATPLLPAGRSPSPPRQGADPEEPLTFVGEAKARGVLLPCGAAAQLLQEEAEQECGQGQPVARGSPHGGTGQWAGSACPHSTMVQRRDATSNAGCKQRRGKAAAVLTAPVWALGRQLWLEHPLAFHLPGSSRTFPVQGIHRPAIPACLGEVCGVRPAGPQHVVPGSTGIWASWM